MWQRILKKISGRKYGLIEEYKMEDAEYAVVIIGSAAGTTKDAIDHMRENGEKVGLVRLDHLDHSQAKRLQKH